MSMISCYVGKKENDDLFENIRLNMLTWKTCAITVRRRDCYKDDGMDYTM